MRYEAPAIERRIAISPPVIEGVFSEGPIGSPGPIGETPLWSRPPENPRP
jgi:hypothetical protein